MPANSTHPEHDATAADWSRARDVLAGEDSVRSGGERYLPRLDSQTDEEYAAYRQRASFFNGTARTAEGYIGLIFRRPPFVKLPELGFVTRVHPITARQDGESRIVGGLAKALAGFSNDSDMLARPLAGYAKNVVSKVLAVGRADSLLGWESVEGRPYVCMYSAEQILNCCLERVALNRD